MLNIDVCVVYTVHYITMHVVCSSLRNSVLLLTRDLLPTANSNVRLIEGGVNNLPDDHSHRAAMDIYDLLQSLTEDDLVLALISGIVLCLFLD